MAIPVNHQDVVKAVLDSKAVRLVCATVVIGILVAAATPASAQICIVPHEFEFPCTGPGGCIVWIQSHSCSGYGSGSTCDCGYPSTCCGHSITKVGLMSCTSSCAGCDDNEKGAVRRGSNRPPSNEQRSTRRNGKGTPTIGVQTKATTTELAQSSGQLQ
jgi:hypothetical protein